MGLILDRWTETKICILIFVIVFGLGFVSSFLSGDTNLPTNIDVNMDLQSSQSNILQLSEDSTRNIPTTKINIKDNLENIDENTMYITRSEPTTEENVEIRTQTKTNLNKIISNSLEEKNGWKLTESEIEYCSANYNRIYFNIPKDDMKLNDHTIEIDTTQEATEYDNIKPADIDNARIFLEMKNEEKKQNIILRINFNKNQIQAN